MQAALHGVGLGSLRGPPRAAEAPPGCRFGLAPCVPRVLSPAYSFPALDPDEMRYNEISREPDGQFYCALCWKHPTDEWQVIKHLQSKEHEKRILNREYEKDPLACVPSPHREFTVILGGWATCRLCNKRMDESHWNSDKHIRYLNYYLGQQNVLCNVGSLPLPLPDTQLPLPQPPPPPEPPSIGYGIAAGGIVNAAAGSLVAASNTSTSCAHTLRGAHGDNMLAASDTYGQPVQGCPMSGSTQRPNPMAVPCGPVACQLLPLPLAPLPRDSLPLKESAPCHDQQHPWGTRSPHDEVLSDDEWNQILQEFDMRYAGDWWPIDTEWDFIDV
jgi:hypothetical protein